MRKKTAFRPLLSAGPAAPLDNPEPSALLAAFYALAPNDFYTMGAKESVIRGYDYYRQQRLLHYVWSPNRATLTASVQGQRSRPYAVSFSLDGGFLTATCDCPAWEPDWLCKHVLCACFTTKNLLSSDAFRLPWAMEPSRETLKTELLGSAHLESRPRAAVSLKAGFEIVIDARHHEPSLFLRRDGMKMDWSFGWEPARAAPPELIPLLNASRFTPGYGEDPLLRYLREDSATYPLILETRHETVSLRWEPSVACLCKTALDVIEDQVTARAVCLAGGIELARFVRFRSFVIDLHGGRLLRLRDEQGWNVWLAFQHGMDVHHPFLMHDWTVGTDIGAVVLPNQSDVRLWQSRSENLAVTRPLREFQMVQIDIILKHLDEVERDLILTVNGRRQTLPRRNTAPNADPPVHRLVLISPSASHEMPPSPYIPGPSRCLPRLLSPPSPALPHGRRISPHRRLRQMCRRCVRFRLGL